MAGSYVFLAAWWLLFLAAALASWISVRASTHQDLRAAELAYLRGDHVNAQRRFPRPVPTTAGGAALVAAWVLVIGGAIALFFMRDWTKLHVLSTRLWVVLIGCGLVWAARRYRHQDRVVQVLKRAALLLTAALLIVVGVDSLFGDVIRDRRVVEGRLDGVAAGRKNDRHQLFIDGRKYHATRDVYEHAREGDRVRLSIGAGTGTVFKLEAL